MAKFKFRLATLLRLREAARDERRGHLAEALRAEELLNRRAAELDASVAELRSQINQQSLSGTIDVEKLINSQRYGALLEAERVMLAQQASQVADEIENRRQALLAADREVHVLEKLRENQQRAHREHEERTEMKALDEIAGRSRGGEQMT
jgi:flagellar export protein FliJ